MRRVQFLGVVAVGLWLTLIVRNQVPSHAALSEAQRAHLKDERFQMVTSIRGLPLGVRESLQTVFGGSSLDIAEPDAEFQGAGTSVDSKLPTRRLVAAGCSSDHCLVYYERGGQPRSWRATLFHWTPAETRFEWGSVAPGGLASVGDVRNAIVSGEVKTPAGSW